MRVTGLYVAGALAGALAVACGGSTASVSGGDAGGNGGSSSGSGSGSGSSSGNGSSSSSSSSSGAGASSGASSGTNPGMMITCLDASGCNSGEVCCVSLMGTTPSSACSATCAGKILQLCASAAECLRPGDVCTPIPQTMGAANMCSAGGGQPKPDGGMMHKDDAGASPDAQASVDSGMDSASPMVTDGSSDGSAE